MIERALPRETPLRIQKRTVDVGPVWATEAMQARASQLPFEVIEPGAHLDQRDNIHYDICRLQNSSNRQNAQKFIEFMLSKSGQENSRKFGFLPHLP